MLGCPLIARLIARMMAQRCGRVIFIEIIAGQAEVASRDAIAVAVRIVVVFLRRNSTTGIEGVQPRAGLGLGENIFHNGLYTA